MRMRNLSMALVVIVAALAAMLGTASTATAGVPDVAPKKAAAASKAVNARMSTMDCNGVTYAHNGYSYGWGNSRNRVIYGLGSAGNVRAVKIFADGISWANWSIGVITWSGAVVESSASGPYYCVEVPSSAKGAILTSRYNGNTVKDRVYW